MKINKLTVLYLSIFLILAHAIVLSNGDKVGKDTGNLKWKKDKVHLEVDIKNFRNTGTDTFNKLWMSYDYVKSLIGDGEKKLAPYKQLKTTTEVLLNFTEIQFKDELNKMWDCVVEAMVMTEYSNMFDPKSGDLATNKDDSLITDYKEQSFHETRVAFRGDDRAPEADISPFNIGFKPWYKYTPEDAEKILKRSGQGKAVMCVVGTKMEKGIYWNRVNKDIHTPSGVCVSRTFKGATVFPRGKDGDAYIYAVQVFGSGADTEAKQRKDREVKALWRPGEKAFEEIEAKDVIACIKFHKTMKDAQKRGDVWFTWYTPWKKWKYNRKWVPTQSLKSKQNKYLIHIQEKYFNNPNNFILEDDFRKPRN